MCISSELPCPSAAETSGGSTSQGELWNDNSKGTCWHMHLQLRGVLLQRCRVFSVSISHGEH